MEINTDKLSLENAITHLKQDLLDNDKWCASDKCRQDHEQLLAFLLELQGFRNEKKLDELQEVKLKAKSEKKMLAYYRNRFIDLLKLLHTYYEGSFKDVEKLSNLYDELVAMSKDTLIMLDLIQSKNSKQTKAKAKL